MNDNQVAAPGKSRPAPAAMADVEGNGHKGGDSEQVGERGHHRNLLEVDGGDR
jgi:hypothetical protein